MSRPALPPRLRVEWWTLALLMSAAAAALIFGQLTQRLDWALYDKLLGLDHHAPDPRILIVTIDDPALQAVEPWPWRRETHARLIQRLQAAGPRAIAYDVLFMESRPGDPALGQAMQRGAPVLVPLLIEAPGPNGSKSEVRLPVPEVAEAAAGLGHVNLIFDSDGRVRRVRPSIADGTRAWPQLMQHLSEVLAKDGTAAVRSQTDTAPVLIPFAGPAGSFPTISAAAVVRGEVPAELIRGRLVLVAATAYGLGDRHPVPIDAPNGVMSGIEIQANLLDGLLSDRLIAQAGPASRLALTLAALWLALVCLRAPRPRTTVLVLAAIACAVCAISLGVLLWLRLWLSPAPALLLMLLSYPLWAWRRLAAISSYVVGRLEGLRAEPGLFPPAPARIGTSDPVERQLGLLDDAIDRLRDMRRFVTDSLQQIPDAVFVTDERGAVLFSNETARSLTDELAPAYEGAIAPMLAQCKRTSTFGRNQAGNEAVAPLWPPQRDGRAEILSPGGRCFDLRYIARTAADGRQAGWIVRLTDITAIWTAQRQREEVLQFLTHDMRSPQASILAVLSEAKRSQISAGIAERIELYARRTLALADGFVQLARAELARYDLAPENLPDILADALDDLWPQIKAKRLTVEEQGLEGECLVDCERSLLTRAFINLIDNAVKFSGEGGQIVVKLEINRAGAAPEALCSITDWGAGIGPQHLERLFERFRRAPTRAGDSPEGVGLGLSIVHAVVARHGGKVTCASDPERGTVFTVSLPLADAPEAVTPAA